MNKNKNNFSENFLQITLKMLTSAQKGVPIDSIIDNNRGTPVSKTATDCLFQYFRHKGVIDYCVNEALTKKTKNKFKNIIKIALIQTRYQNGINPFVAVDCAVAFTKKKYGKMMSGVVNATLRKILSMDFDELINNAPDSIKLNIPEVVLKKWKKQFDQNTIENISKTLLKQSLLSFRAINKTCPVDFENFNCKKIQLPQWADDYVFYQTDSPSVIFENKWIEKGYIYIQDPATVSPSSFFQPKTNNVVLDLCAAPGGKSTTILEKMKDGILIASDSSYNRQKRTTQNLAQYISDNKAYICISSAEQPSFQKEIANCIILDVPCSNTGVARKRPDALWNFSMQKLNRLLMIQKNILSAAIPILKKGGTIIYSTCSIEEDENTLQIANFLKENKEFSLISERLLLPNELHDGAYCALLQKNS